MKSRIFPLNCSGVEAQSRNTQVAQNCIKYSTGVNVLSITDTHVVNMDILTNTNAITNTTKQKGHTFVKKKTQKRNKNNKYIK